MLVVTLPITAGSGFSLLPMMFMNGVGGPKYLREEDRPDTLFDTADIW